MLEYFLGSGFHVQADLATVREHGFVKVDQFWDAEELQALRTGLTYLQAKGRLANVACEGDGVTHTEIPKNLQLPKQQPWEETRRGVRPRGGGRKAARGSYLGQVRREQSCSVHAASPFGRV